MTYRQHSFVAAAVAAIAGVILLVQGCSSGSGGSEVGHREAIAPTARVQALNGGENNTYREGSEVLLSGKDSEDGDGPVLNWSWQQTDGPAVRLIERNNTTVSFTAPPVVDETTKLTFELTVEDTDHLTGSASLDVYVTPARDPNKFLSLDVRGTTRNTFDRFQVVAALADDASTGSTPKPFTLSARAYLIYPPRSAPNTDCAFDLGDFEAGIPTETATGCLVALLQDLTPAALPSGGTGIQGEWPANVRVERPSGLTADQLKEQLKKEWWNPHYTFEIPRLDVMDFNQQFVDSGDRSRMLDLFNTAKTHIALIFELTAPQNQENATLIVNDIESAPITAPTSASAKRVQVETKLVDNAGAGLPTQAVLSLEQVLGSIPGRESALTAEVYYETVDPYPHTRLTLNDWLFQAGFASDGTGTLLPDAVKGVGQFAHAVYLNNYDLGFGRDMYTRIDEFGNVYAFVNNYSTLEAAIRKSSPIAAVAMEYSPLNNASDPTEKFVKFFTYVDDGAGNARRVTSMNFDGRGEMFTPGNCLACHGGAKPPGIASSAADVSALEFDSSCGDRLKAACYSWPTTGDIPNGDLHATFLPWDVGALLFTDTDPAITDAPVRFDGISLLDRLKRDYGDYSRAAQEAQIKKLNEAAYSTYCDVKDCPTYAARQLVEHWYGDVDGTLAETEFNDSTAVEGWRNGESVPDPKNAGSTVPNPDDAEELYHDVYAQHCRMCHTNISDETLRFDTYAKFVSSGLIQKRVYEDGVMPAARLTLDRFWVPQDGSPIPAQTLAAHLGLSSSLGPSPRAKIDGASSADRYSVLRLSALDSTFASSYDWSVAYDAPAALAFAPSVLGFQPSVVGAGTAEPSLVLSKPGTYAATLAINGADPSSGGDLVATHSVVVKDFIPVTVASQSSVEPGQTSSPIYFLRDDCFASPEAESQDCAASTSRPLSSGPDLALTYSFYDKGGHVLTFDSSGQLATTENGVFHLVTGAPCTSDPQERAGCVDDYLTYTTKEESTQGYTDTLYYRVTDVDGEISSATPGEASAPYGAIEVVVTPAVKATLTVDSVVVSDYPANLTLTITGGASANPRYSVVLAQRPPGSVFVGSTDNPKDPCPNGSTEVVPDVAFSTNDAELNFVYCSNDFYVTDVGKDDVIEFKVTTGTETVHSLVDFQVRPQAPYSGDVIDEKRQLGKVVDQWDGNNGALDCTVCHKANNYFDLNTSDANVYSQLVGDFSDSDYSNADYMGHTKIEASVDDSLILCYPGRKCAFPDDSTKYHPIPEPGQVYLPEKSLSYEVIKRWIQEGARDD